MSISSSASRRGSVLPGLYPHEQDFTLDFEHPERNPNGMFAFTTPNVDVPNSTTDEVVHVATVYKAVTDMRDMGEFGATLLEDGSGFILMEPSVPRFILEPEDLHDLEGEELCVEVMKSHQLNFTAIDKRKNRQSKQGTFHFPHDIQCTRAHFGNHPNGTLQNQFRVLTVAVQAGKTQDIPFIFWKITIDQEARHTRNHKVDPLAEAYERMSLSKARKSGPLMSD
jgi:hypothetical protein